MVFVNVWADRPRTNGDGKFESIEQQMLEVVQSHDCVLKQHGA